VKFCSRSPNALNAVPKAEHAVLQRSSTHDNSIAAFKSDESTNECGETSTREASAHAPAITKHVIAAIFGGIYCERRLFARMHLVADELVEEQTFLRT
jgi:hypothetical protein